MSGKLPPDRVPFDDEKTDPGIKQIPSEFLEDEITDPGIIVVQPGNSEADLISASTGIPIDLGVIEDYLADPSINEIMVNDTRNIMLEKAGRMIQANARIETTEALTKLSREVMKLTDLPFNPENPTIDLSLPDGSRLNMIGPPLTRSGICITIRKFPKRYSMHQLQQLGTFDERMGVFLQKCIAGRLNIMISGGTGSGKTTLLAALSGSISKEERVITIEDTPELKLSLPNVVQMYTRPKMGNTEAITQRELLVNSLRMRPDRIILGECRRGEALDMLQAMNTGHDGSITTLHANTPRDGLARLETLCMMAGLQNLSQIAVRRQIAASLELLIHVERVQGGKRRITKISEITGMESDVISLQDLFHYEFIAKDPYNKNQTKFGDQFICDGYLPNFLDKLKLRGIEFQPRFFG
ncbi:MAG: CpaF family protein [Xanthomonadaceae bacterium]|nr:CpaF family protein [Xanthomonadaceae bacterium]